MSPARPFQADDLAARARDAWRSAMPSSWKATPGLDDAARLPEWAEPVRPELPGTENLWRVAENFYRGGQPDATGFRALEGLGIRTVISLRQTVSDLPLAAGSGLVLVRVPMKSRYVSENKGARIVRAMQALDLTNLTTRAEADRRLALTTPDPALRAFFLQSLDLKGEDGPRWRLNLAVLASRMPGIVGWPGTPGQFPRPALFLSGADSTYVLPEHRPAITGHFPAARFARIPDTGHWLHAEKPREFAETVAVFLSAGREHAAA